MDKNRFKTGTTIRGKDLKEYILCKVISGDMMMRGFRYAIGMNKDVNPFTEDKGSEVGLHFCLIDDICCYLESGTLLAIVQVPDDEVVCVEDDCFRTHRLNIIKTMRLDEIATWEYLHKNGVDITTDDNFTVRFAAVNGYLEIVKYLHGKGADITAVDNDPVCLAAVMGHLEVVRYLHENGADITAGDDCAVRYAAENGHLEVVRYLYENGADIATEENEALCLAIENGHMDVVKYLQTKKQ